MIAAIFDQDQEFLQAMRTIPGKIKKTNLVTSPDRRELMLWRDEELLVIASEPNTFIGEENM